MAAESHNAENLAEPIEALAKASSQGGNLLVTSGDNFMFHGMFKSTEFPANIARIKGLKQGKKVFGVQKHVEPK